MLVSTAAELPTADGGARLLRGRPPHGPLSLIEHLALHGPVPVLGAGELARLATAAGLRGRGGAWFPTGRKLTAVADRAVAAGAAHVLVNGMESEPLSGGDALLLGSVPHLVLDGAELAARAVGATAITVCVPAGGPGTIAVRTAVAERSGWPGGLAMTVQAAPERYVASEATALARFVGGGPAKPRSVATHRRGVGGEPTLVCNVQTFAHIALLARRGVGWFREVGTAEAPGTALFTVSGAVCEPGVYELPVGVSAATVLNEAGGPAWPVRALLIGGYGGSWLAPNELARPLSPEALADVDASPGTGLVVALPPQACGLAETVRVATWLGGHTTGQCPPCVSGLPAVADDLAAAVRRGDTIRLDRLRFRLRSLPGRGGCNHPDGAIRLVRTALAVFADELTAHLAGRPCVGCAANGGYLPVPALPAPGDGWY